MAELKPQEITQAEPKSELVSMLKSPDFLGKVNETLNSKAPGFITSVLNTVDSNPALKKVAQFKPESIVRSALVAASLDLPIDKNLGFAWIIPYDGEAQFQIGAKGFIQLAQRTSQYLKMTLVDVFKNQFKSWNPLTETLDADFAIQGEGEVIGFAFYFKLINGFEKLAFSYKKDLMAHGEKYSKSFKSGPWQTNSNEMCKKTLAKQTIKQWGIMSTEMQTAIKADQAVIKSDNPDDESAYAYIDNPSFKGETIDIKHEGDQKQ